MILDGNGVSWCISFFAQSLGVKFCCMAHVWNPVIHWPWIVVDFRVWRRLQPANSSFQNANLLFQYGVQKSIEIYSNGAQKNPAALSMARQAVLRLQPCHGNFTAGETHGVGGFRPKFPKKNRVNQFPDSTMGKKYIAGLEKRHQIIISFQDNSNGSCQSPPAASSGSKSSTSKRQGKPGWRDRCARGISKKLYGLKYKHE